MAALNGHYASTYTHTWKYNRFNKRKEELPIEVAIELITERAIDSLVQEIVREERYSLRHEKKRPWSIKTRRLFRGKIDKVEITFRERIELAERVARELGVPYLNFNETSNRDSRGKSRGRPPVYDVIKLAAAILVKGMLSFVDISTELKNIEYDMTVDGSKRFPCSSELHIIFQKISKEWLAAALQRLNELSVEEFSKFDESLDIFVIDGSALTGETLMEREVAMKVRLIFDVEDNYRNAEAAYIDLQVKQKKGGVRKSRRKAARLRFDKEKYKKRKLGERSFGNIEVRRSKCYYKKQENKLKGAILIACDHNIIAYFKNKAWCNLFVLTTQT